MDILNLYLHEIEYLIRVCIDKGIKLHFHGYTTHEGSVGARGIYDVDNIDIDLRNTYSEIIGTLKNGIEKHKNTYNENKREIEEIYKKILKENGIVK